jgi:hypothetical protein
VNEFFLRRSEKHFPRVLYDLVADCFAIAQCWEPYCPPGPERGREFERTFLKYCDLTGKPLSERPGSRTLNAERSASGFNHESDAVIAWPSFIVHAELKYLSSELDKNELLIFHQKGLDFLAAARLDLRKPPLYRLLLSGRLISEEARQFALQWGIIVVEPERLPLLLVHYLAGCLIPSLDSEAKGLQDEVWEEVPRIVSSAQKRVERFASLLGTDQPLLSETRMARALELYQLVFGDACWTALDQVEPGWIEQRYDCLDVET